jgi:hypothetical protein
MLDAGEQITLVDIMAGLKFSWPIYMSGFRVMVSQRPGPTGIWSFASAFHWTVWAAIGGTIVYMGFMIALVEIITFRRGANKKGGAVSQAHKEHASPGLYVASSLPATVYKNMTFCCRCW